MFHPIIVGLTVFNDRITCYARVFLFVNNDSWFASTTSKFNKPIRIYVTLPDLGARECGNNPYLGDRIVMNPNGEGGYIDKIIDYSDLEYTGRFFMQLGNQVKVIEPEEMKAFLCMEARKIIDNYGG